MAHYAFLDDNNIVTEVITGKDETELIDGLTPEEWYGNYRGQVCVRTSYNNNIRYNYAGVAYYYDPIDDAFIAPMPECGHESLLLNAQKRWECAECEALRETNSL
jgi:ribosomal protein S27AE